MHIYAEIFTFLFIVLRYMTQAAQKCIHKENIPPKIYIKKDVYKNAFFYGNLFAEGAHIRNNTYKNVYIGKKKCMKIYMNTTNLTLKL